MKWRLSTESIRQKELPDHKSMSYAITHDDAHVKNKKMLTKGSDPPSVQKYKTKSIIESTIDYSNQIQHKYDISVEDAQKNSSDIDKLGSNGNIFTISSNQSKQSVPWVIPTEQTMTNIAGGPISDNNLNAMILDNYVDETNNDFHYLNSNTSPSSRNSLNKNGSTVKLVPSPDDLSSTQSKCSIFRGLILCLCLNVTYTNIVRFPRELERNGTAFLIPYLILLLLVGLPIILLEVSIGQFLGQGAAHSWRASPIFKGAAIVSRIASWLAGVWISLHAVLAIVYVGMLIFKTVPFMECESVRMAQGGYEEYRKRGQECLQKTLLSPVWESTLAFALLTFGLIFFWMIIMGFTHSAKVFRRTSFLVGVIGFTLLIALTGWEVHDSLKQQHFPEIWPFHESKLISSTLWFNALVQVVYSTNIGFGVIPVITGKFLYKGDAVRTSVVYLCFNLLINAISVTLFMDQFDNIFSRNTTIPFAELKPLTAIYDNALDKIGPIKTRLIPGLIYALIAISSILTISITIFTSSRIFSRHPNYIFSLVALFVSIATLICPRYLISSVLDTRIVPTLVIASLVFDLIATTWIYGAKNIYTDLEFSIGRSILKTWLALWCFSPVILTGLLVWWCVGDEKNDLLSAYMPRWGPILFVMAIILIIACIEIFKQVDYNFFGMICEAAKPAKEWGPADPLARHAWKQWRSVCQDTGQRDFTLRRRGTRDYTHSIKKGQYSSNKYGSPNWKSSTPGSSSPNYSGSVFGDSAIEEDMSVDKYSGVNQQFAVYPGDNTAKHGVYSSRSRRALDKRSNFGGEKHKEIVYVRRPSNESNSTKVEITPASDGATCAARNPLAKSPGNFTNTRYSTTQKQNHQLKPSNSDHICWRKFSVNSEEYSTEL